MMFSVGCTTTSHEAKAPLPTFTKDMAESTLGKIVSGVAENGIANFCTRHVRSAGTCEMLLNDALKWCLLPGDKPKVMRGVLIPQKGPSEGGWLLEIRGTTMDGQQYVSEFFVIQLPDGKPQAASGVYWTGLGLEESPFGHKNTKVPQNACPGK
nr:hypothetical protein [Microbispora rosea]